MLLMILMILMLAFATGCTRIPPGSPRVVVERLHNPPTSVFRFVDEEANVVCWATLQGMDYLPRGETSY